MRCEVNCFHSQSRYWNPNWVNFVRASVYVQNLNGFFCQFFNLETWVTKFDSKVFCDFWLNDVVCFVCFHVSNVATHRKSASIFSNYFKLFSNLIHCPFKKPLVIFRSSFKPNACKLNHVILFADGRLIKHGWAFGFNRSHKPFVHDPVAYSAKRCVFSAVSDTGFWQIFNGEFADLPSEGHYCVLAGR